jgi:hypothetical protein
MINVAARLANRNLLNDKPGYLAMQMPQNGTSGPDQTFDSMKLIKKAAPHPTLSP